jgi:hypothetical protein
MPNTEYDEPGEAEKSVRDNIKIESLLACRGRAISLRYDVHQQAMSTVAGHGSHPMVAPFRIFWSDVALPTCSEGSAAISNLLIYSAMQLNKKKSRSGQIPDSINALHVHSFRQYTSQQL